MTSKRVGVIGYCMGGGLALWLGRCAPRRSPPSRRTTGSIPWPAAQPDYSRLDAPVQGHYAGQRRLRQPRRQVHALEKQLHDLGKTAEFFIYPDADHAFSNHHRPEVFHAEHTGTAWQRTLAFFRANVT